MRLGLLDDFRFINNINMRYLLLLITFIYLPNNLIAQIIVGGDSGSDYGDPKKFEKWIVGQKSEYQGEYHFGFSEGESMFFLIVKGDSCYAMRKYGEFINNGHNYQWHAIALSNVRIDGNKFYSDQINGEFTIYDWGNKKSKGLIVYKLWNHKVNKKLSEFGFLSSKVDVWFYGKYPYTSYRLLRPDELNNMTLQDLKIMRNEIYARYGLKFKPNGDMDKYFRNQKWYNARFDNVDHSLTEIEQQNIQLILITEKSKNVL
jgi:hypothetical protein